MLAMVGVMVAMAMLFVLVVKIIAILRRGGNGEKSESGGEDSGGEKGSQHFGSFVMKG